MQKITLLIAFSIITSIIFAQPNTFVFKAQMIEGYIIPTNKTLESINPSPTLGGELSIEFPSWGEFPWQQYLNKPTLGVGFVGLNLGNTNILGQTFAVYPYLLIGIIRRPHFELEWKGGVGLSFFNKTFNRVYEEYNSETVPGWSYYGPYCNNLIGSIVNVYITTAAHFNFPIKKSFAVNADFGYMHMSNGSVLQPNGGINIMYAAIGGSYKLHKDGEQHEYYKEKRFPSLPYKWSINITGSGGYRELYYGDNKGYGVASLHIGATYNICNWYALGGSIDGFYDGVFNPDTKFGRYILEDKTANLFRVAVSLNNEFRVGRITTILDWGIYLYDPIKLAYKDENGKKYDKRPILYKYNIEKEDGWNYFRLGLRCRVWDNLYMQVAVKAHQTKAEMVEWGVGYQIPIKKKIFLDLSDK